MTKKIIVSTILLMVAVASITPLFAQDSYEMAKSAYQKKQFDTALKHARITIQEYPDWFGGYYVAGLAYFEKGNYKEAAKSFSKVREYADNDETKFKGYFKTAESYYKNEDWGNCLNQLNSAGRLSGTKGFKRVSGKYTTMKGWCNFNVGKYNQVIASFKPDVDSGKADANMLRAVARSYMMLNQNSLAIRVISQVVQKDPKDLSAHKILVRSYNNEKKFSQAVSAAAFAISNFPRDWELHYLRGAAHKELRQYSLAERELRKSLSIASRDKVRRLLAETLMSQSKFVEAAKEFTAAQSSYTNDAKFYYNIAFCWASFVPKDTEKYKDKPQERQFKTALSNADVAVKHAKTLRGADGTKLAALEGAIAQKLQRLEQGATYEELYEKWLNPETGVVEERLIKKGK